ncbi:MULTISPECIES: alpha-hydroxy acid oxidase [Halomonas]|uniref:alpha-hydroxy acid oxidase n=1 Tax=Halomonas TaxID=2745 RepID=UPI000D15A618|nr:MULTISPECIES: alpha-hydroxy acid oxidase [Halomonas]MDR5890979.1 alpha-hydroxy acid oxidase [Halomonas salina]RAH39386.1 alpha-hydroxy-acid oxidizing protein [Halomonas sp. SL1]WJY07518.1 alpha-hydroxy acid oxidase [Halomonas halophila]
MERASYAGTDYRKALNIEDLARIARRRLPHFVHEYLEGGADDERTLDRNRRVFDDYRFEPKTLTRVGPRDLSTTLLGRQHALPLVIGPTGYNGMMTKNGDLKLAAAASAANIPFVLSNVATTSLEEIADVEDLRAWMQIYFYRDRDYVRKLVERCRTARYETLVVTTDSAIYGNREWDLRNFRKPMQPTLRNLLHLLTRPRWIADVLIPDGMPTFKNLGDLLPPGKQSVQGASAIIGQQLDPSLNWDDIAWLRDHWQGKLIVKGILAPAEAEQAATLGVDGVVLSNHGGRQLDSACSPLEVLPDARKAVGERCQLFIDSGFRRGTDIVKALALGADAVWLGRATLYGLAAGGQAGVAHALDLLRGEVDRTIGLLGLSQASELGPEVLGPDRRHT